MPGSPVAQALPPWSATTRWTVARPMPVPSNSASLCRRWNGANRRWAYSGSNPAPLSRTKKAVSPPGCACAPNSTRACVPLPLNFHALPKRFSRATRMSAKSHIAVRPSSTTSSVRAGSRPGGGLPTSSASAERSTRCGWKSCRLTRARPIRSSISAFIRTVAASTRSRAFARSASSALPCSLVRMRTNPSMARSGARRSCETEYEKASSSRLEASSCAVRSATRRSSDSWRAAISRSRRMRRSSACARAACSSLTSATALMMNRRPSSSSNSCDMRASKGRPSLRRSCRGTSAKRPSEVRRSRSAAACCGSA